MSVTWLKVTTSACRPSATARACFDEPPCDWRISTCWPVFAFHCAWNAGFTCVKRSRATSYEALSSPAFFGACAWPAAAESSTPANNRGRLFTGHAPGEVVLGRQSCGRSGLHCRHITFYSLLRTLEYAGGLAVLDRSRGHVHGHRRAPTGWRARYPQAALRKSAALRRRRAPGHSRRHGTCGRRAPARSRDRRGEDGDD